VTLVRPQNRLEGEQEQTLEATILGELELLNAKVTAISDSQRYMRVMLMGGEFGEIRHDGKLPLLEAKLKLAHASTAALELRTKSLEDDRLRFKTATRTAAAIGGLVGGVSATVATIAVEILTHK
jgi:hypothetical protein